VGGGSVGGGRVRAFAFKTSVQDLRWAGPRMNRFLLTFSITLSITFSITLSITFSITT
jgi:hypothetical protein